MVGSMDVPLRPDLDLKLQLVLWFLLVAWGSGLIKIWFLSGRARLLPLGTLPFRCARPQEPPACQTDLCSQEKRGGGEGRSKQT